MNGLTIFQCYICLLFLLGGSASMGQSSILIQGNVTDTTGRPLSMVSISLLESSSTSVRAFCNTDDNGHYRLLLPMGTSAVYTLTVRSLGYAIGTSSVEVNRIRPTYDFILRPIAQTLNEVLVRAPIVQRNDTTSFDLKQFSDTTSAEKLESVLKRLPGFEVNDGGQIYFKGRRVEKLLLDGDDLFDNRYTIATRSLRASLVDKVQAIEGYQKNQLLKGFKRSDNVAINLVVKPDKQKILTGSADLTTNFGNRYQTRTSALTYAKSLKGMWVADANTITAETTAPALTQPASDDDEKAIPSMIRPSAVINLDYPQPTGLRTDRFLDSRSQSGAANVTNSWGKRVKSTAYLLAFNDRKLFNQRTDENYLRLSDKFLVSEQQTNWQTGQLITGQHTLDISASNRTQIQILSHSTYSPRTYEQTIFTNLNNNTVQERLNSTHRMLVQRVQGTHRFSDNNAIQSTVQYTDHRTIQRFKLPLLAQPGLGSGVIYTPTYQNNQLDRQELSGEAEWLWRSRSGYNGSVQGGFVQTWQEQSVAVTTNDTAPTDTASSLADSQYYRIDHYTRYFRFLLRRTLNRTEMSVGVGATQAGGRYGQTAVGKLLVCPSITLRHSLSSTAHLLISYRYRLDDQTLQHYYPGTLLTSYRSRYQGLDTTAFWGDHFLFANVSKQDLLANRRFGLTAIVSRKDNTLLNDLTIHPYLVSTQIEQANRPAYYTNLTGTVEQLVVPLNIVLKGQAAYSSMQRFNRVNTIDQGIWAVHRKIGLEINTVLNKPFAINLGGQYIINDTRLEQNGVDRVLKTKSLLFQEKITAKISQVRLRINGQQFYTFSREITGRSQFFDVNAEYTTTQKKLTVALECRNVLNEQAFVFQTTHDLSITSARYNVLGRWLLLSMSYPF